MTMITHLLSDVVKQKEKRIKFVHKKLQLRKAEVASQRFFPPLGSEVYREVLADLKIQCVVCKGSADGVVSKIANYSKCPVLSSDSDFYMYNLHSGFVTIIRTVKYEE